MSPGNQLRHDGHMRCSYQIYLALQLREKDDATSLSLSLEAFIDRYTADANQGIVEFINFLMRASGIQPSQLELAATESDDGDVREGQTL